MAVLSLNDVKKSYKLGDGTEFPVLKGINVSFEKGELVSIIGESGSGKSTLMNIIGGLDSKFEGEVLVDGKNIGSFTEKELDIYRKNKIGFIFQSFNLVPHLTILDNVALALTLSNVKRSEQIERAKEMLEKVGLKDHIHKKPNQLSGGQMQRVAIARALINDPEMIVADEPTGSLDSQTTQQILDIITQIAQEGKLVLLVTHSEHVAECSSRVIRIADGQIVEDKQGITLTPKETAETAKTKETVGFGYGKHLIRGKKAFVPDGNFEVAASGWLEYGTALWHPKDQCPANLDHRVHCSIDPVPYPGDHAAGWYLLWAECGEQKYAGGRSEETSERKFFPSGCQRFGKKFLSKRRDCGPCLVYGR